MLISKFTVCQENANINSADNLRRRAQNRKKQTWKATNKKTQETLLMLKIIYDRPQEHKAMKYAS
jgi:hypothetical protein